MSIRNLTIPMQAVIDAVNDGAKIESYINPKGDRCFKCDTYTKPRLNSVLYLTITCRAMLKRDLIKVSKGGLVLLNSTEVTG